MARTSLKSKEIAELMKGLSQLISVQRIVKNLDVETLTEVIYKFENAGKSDKEIIRESEDSYDTFAQPRVGNCECCDE